MKNEPFRISDEAAFRFAKRRSPHLIVQTGFSCTSLLNSIARLSGEIDVAYYLTPIPTGEGLKSTSPGDVARFVDGQLVDVYSKNRGQSGLEAAIELFDILLNDGKHSATKTSEFNDDVLENVRAALEEQAQRHGGEPGASSTDEPREGQRGEDAGDSAKSEPPSSESEERTPFDVLDIPPDSTKAQVKAAYRDFCKVCHPDKFSRLSRQVRRAAEEEMKRLNIAREAALGLIEKSAQQRPRR